MKKIKVKLSEDAKEVYTYLKENATKSKTERIIFKAVTNKIELLKSDIHYGQPIAHNLIPKVYFEKYEINNIFRVKLPNYWRMLYSLKDDDKKIEIIAFVIDIMDHSNYNKKFGYEKK